MMYLLSRMYLGIIYLLSFPFIINGFNGYHTPFLQSLSVAKCVSCAVSSSHNILTLKNALSLSNNLPQKNRDFSLKNVPGTISSENNVPEKFPIVSVAPISVDKMMEMTSDTDKGANASKELQETVNNWVITKSGEYAASLSLINNRNNGENNEDNKANGITALDDQNIFGNYDVSFVSTFKANEQQGNPAGSTRLAWKHSL